MIRKRHLALGNKGLAVNSIQMLLLQLAPNAGFSKKVYTVVSVSAMLVSMRQKNIAQVSILERYFFVSTYQAAGPDTCLAVFVVASLPPCL